MAITSSSTVKSLTGLQTLKYNSNGVNYTGQSVSDIMTLIAQTGLVDNVDTDMTIVSLAFSNTIKKYQKAIGVTQDGILTDSLLNNIYQNAMLKSNTVISSDSTTSSEYSNVTTGDPHYDSFFSYDSSKPARKNRKDIVISLGNGANTKTIKEVFMRSVSVQVDTSGNPISEVYNFIARDIKESDATEDESKYLGEQDTLSSASDIKYNYDSLDK